MFFFDKMPDKTISCIVIAHNGEQWLRDCFESIQSQQYSPFELIYIDSSSDDSSCDISREYTELHLVVPKVGANYARNRGAHMARGEILLFVDGNDRLENTVTREINRAVLEGTKIGTFAWSTENLPLTEYLAISLLNAYDMRAWPCCFVEKQLFLTLGGFDESYHGNNDVAQLGYRAREITRPRKIKTARVYSQMDNFARRGYLREILAWLKTDFDKKTGVEHRIDENGR